MQPLISKLKKIATLLILVLLVGCKKEKLEITNHYERVFVFGDSHTAIFDYGKDIAKELNAPYYDQCAVGGSQAFQYLCDDSINKMALFRPDLVIIRLGTNEIFMSSLDSSFTAYRELVAKIREKTDCKIVVVGVVRMDLFPYRDKVLEYNSFLRTQGDEYIDLYNHSNYFYMDEAGCGIHFNREGYKQQARYTAMKILIDENKID
jgi:hypothetical protein